MVLALQQPKLISALIAVDNAPVDGALSPDFEKYTQAMRSIEAANLTKSSEADQILQRHEKVHYLPAYSLSASVLTRGLVSSHPPVPFD